MKYISTRGQAPVLNFEEVLLAGLASDGGLYVPESLPHYSKSEIAEWQGLPYADLAFRIIQPFVSDSIPAKDLKSIIDESYAGFRHPAVAPLTQLDHNEWILELYHGPTLAFKDFALQLLGRLLDYILQRRHQHVSILGATSGDTGSAAIEGCRRCENVDIYILHPHNRVSDVQRKQMTTVIGENIHNLAVEGNFDDCQSIVKACFNDQSFLQGKQSLVAVNSINWARIMAQIVYYFYAALAVGGPSKKVSFSVPTGNFGDIFAGYLAKQMGLPIEQLVIATNKNDILHRCISNNDYSKKQLDHTLSPSMDIMVSSNFERLLFDLYDRDGVAVSALLDNFNEGAVSLDDKVWQRARENFDSSAVDDDQTCETIAEIFEATELLIDPHTAIGVRAARQCNRNRSIPMITLSTAHPVKFPEAVLKAGCEQPTLPHHMADLFERKERYKVVPNQVAEVQRVITGSND